MVLKHILQCISSRTSCTAEPFESEETFCETVPFTVGIDADDDADDADDADDDADDADKSVAVLPRFPEGGTTGVVDVVECLRFT